MSILSPFATQDGAARGFFSNLLNIWSAMGAALTVFALFASLRLCVFALKSFDADSFVLLGRDALQCGAVAVEAAGVFTQHSGALEFGHHAAGGFGGETEHGPHILAAEQVA